MFRATSEIAVAIKVRSVPLNPMFRASSRPFWRATTMSESCRIGTRISLATAAAPRCRLPQAVQTFLEIKRRVDSFQGEPELDHREGHVRLDADHDRSRPPELDRVGHPPEGPGRERVQDVKGRDVHDRAAGTEAPDFIGQ